jgi:hypothetical protein
LEKSLHETDVISFTDRSGQSGTITADFEVEYRGRWAEEVTEYIERVEERHTDDSGNLQVEDAVNQIVLELPERVPIVEVKRDE